jgi:nucleoid-associated protein YgaU
MRKAINNNPIVQIGLLGALGVLVAVVFMSNMGGGAPPPAEEDATATESATSAAPATPATSAAPADPAVPATPAPEAAPSAALPGATAFEPSKGLPADVVNAYESGDVVVLLVMEKNGYEDKAILRDVESLESRGDTSVFIAESKDVSKYSRIAEGVSLDRVPAIIVLHPPKGKLPNGESSPFPLASVSYGYRGEESVIQAVNDALYEGKRGTYAP